MRGDVPTMWYTIHYEDGRELRWLKGGDDVPPAVRARLKGGHSAILNRFEPCCTPHTNYLVGGVAGKIQGQLGVVYHHWEPKLVEALVRKGYSVVRAISLASVACASCANELRKLAGLPEVPGVPTHSERGDLEGCPLCWRFEDDEEID